MRAAFVPGIPKKEVYIMNVKKKIIAACIIALVLSAVVPIPLKNNYGKYDIAALAYRINRIQELTGLDLEQPDVRFNLMIAILMLKTVNGHEML